MLIKTNKSSVLKPSNVMILVHVVLLAHFLLMYNVQDVSLVLDIQIFAVVLGKNVDVSDWLYTFSFLFSD